MVEDEVWKSVESAFQDYVIPLETVTSFKYLGRVLTAVGKDWSAVVENLRKAQKSCAWMTMILRREGAKPRVLGTFLKAVAHTVLLLGSDTWVPNSGMGQSLGIFQHGVARRITGRQLKRQEEGIWENLPLAADMEEAGFEEIGAYILKRYNTVAQYIEARLIMDLCKRSVWRPGDWVARRWWEQEGIKLLGVRYRAAADGERERGGEDMVQ